MDGLVVRARVDELSDGARADAPVGAHEVDEGLAEGLASVLVAVREGRVEDQVADLLRVRGGVGDGGGTVV